MGLPTKTGYSDSPLGLSSRSLGAVSVTRDDVESWKSGVNFQLYRRVFINKFFRQSSRPRVHTNVMVKYLKLIWALPRSRLVTSSYFNSTKDERALQKTKENFFFFRRKRAGSK